MSKHALIEKLEKEQMKQDLPIIHIGDTISVHLKIVEGSKERIQVITGTVISIKGTGLSTMVTLYRVAYGEGMERVIPIHSPRVTKVDIVKRGKVRRSKLNYIRGASGKKARVKGHVGIHKSDRKKADTKQLPAKPVETEVAVKEDTPVATVEEE